jgi:hypothetical protein
MDQSSPYIPSRDALVTDADLRRLARFIAEEHEGLRAVHAPLLSAADVAKRYGLSRGWVYRHARELGGQRLGTGPKARLRFGALEVRRRLDELQRGGGADGRSSRRGTGEPVDLLPIGPRRTVVRTRPEA